MSTASGSSVEARGRVRGPEVRAVGCRTVKLGQGYCSDKASTQDCSHAWQALVAAVG